MEHLLTQPRPSIPAAAHCRVFKDPGSEIKPRQCQGPQDFTALGEAKHTSPHSEALLGDVSRI